MKQIFRHIALSIVLTAGLAAGAQEFISGDFCYRVIGDEEVAVAPWVEQGISQYAGVMIVPETVFYDGQNYRITAVADSAFYNSAITEVQFPNAITYIGSWAMADAFDLTSVTLPLHLQMVSRGMLAGTDITSIVIPEGVQCIDESAFEDCNLLHTVFLPSTLTEMGDYAFDGCHSLFEMYSAAPQPPVWMGEDALPAVNGVDLILADDHAIDTWGDAELWGDHDRFSLWASDEVHGDITLDNELWHNDWNRVDLGNYVAYRVYGEDGYMMAHTTADHYYLPVTDHPAEYVIVLTDGITDADDVVPITVNAPITGIDNLVAERSHPKIYAIDGVLHIEGDNHGTWTTIYDIYGRLYYERPSNDGQVITLHRNKVYIVIVGDYVKKVML